MATNFIAPYTIVIHFAFTPLASVVYDIFSTLTGALTEPSLYFEEAAEEGLPLPVSYDLYHNGNFITNHMFA